MRTYTFHISVQDMPDTWRTVELTGQQTLRDLHVAIQEALDWDPDDDMAFFVGENPLEDSEQFTLDDDWDDEEGLYDDDDQTESMVAEMPPPDLGSVSSPESLEEALTLIETSPEIRAQLRQTLVEQMGVPLFMADLMLGNLRLLMEVMPKELLAGMVGDGPETKNASEATLEGLELTPGQRILYMFGDDDWRFDVRVEAINEAAEDDAFYPLILDGDGPAPQQYHETDENDEGLDWLWQGLEEGEFEDEE